MALMEAVEQKYEIMDNQTKTKYTDWVVRELLNVNIVYIIYAVTYYTYMQYNTDIHKHRWHPTTPSLAALYSKI